MCVVVVLSGRFGYSDYLFSSCYIPQCNPPIHFYIHVDSRGSYEIEITTPAQSQFVARSSGMKSRMLDSRLTELIEGADVGVVSDQVAMAFSELHLSTKAKKCDMLLSGNNYDTVGALQTLSPRELEQLAQFNLTVGQTYWYLPADPVLSEQTLQGVTKTLRTLRGVGVKV